MKNLIHKKWEMYIYITTIITMGNHQSIYLSAKMYHHYHNGIRNLFVKHIGDPYVIAEVMELARDRTGYDRVMKELELQTADIDDFVFENCTVDEESDNFVEATGLLEEYNLYVRNAKRFRKIWSRHTSHLSKSELFEHLRSRELNRKQIVKQIRRDKIINVLGKYIDVEDLRIVNMFESALYSHDNPIAIHDELARQIDMGDQTKLFYDMIDQLRQLWGGYKEDSHRYYMML